MAEYPIIMSAPMVRALLDGRKTQTRRLAWQSYRTQKLQPLSAFATRESLWQDVVPGDNLWVREAWAPYGMEALPDRDRPIFYRADPDNKEGYATPPDIKWRSPIHLPRWASRITLLVTATRIERLQEISEEDAIAEGMQNLGGGEYADCWWPEHDGLALAGGTARDGFGLLWDKLHSPESWSANPEVVVLTFRPILANIDAPEAKEE